MLNEKCRKYTAVSINNEQYKFNRLPFGLKNAPMVFQRVMNDLLSNLNFVKVYLDDVIIFSTTVEKHYKHIKTVIERLHQQGISINFEKSTFFKKEIRFLGNILSEKGIKPDLSRVKFTKEMCNPKSLKQLQRLIGYINWFRSYIPNLSDKMKTITEKT